MKHEQRIDAVQDTSEPALNQDLLLSLVGYNCRRAYLAIMPPIEAGMSKHALRTVDFSVLSLLKANPNITQKRMSRAIHMSPSNLAIMLDTLEARGLLMRLRNPLDKRSQTLLLTPDGLRLSTRAEQDACELEQKATCMLTEQERGQLLALMQKLFLRDRE